MHDCGVAHLQHVAQHFAFLGLAHEGIAREVRLDDIGAGVDRGLGQLLEHQDRIILLGAQDVARHGRNHRVAQLVDHLLQIFGAARLHVLQDLGLVVEQVHVGVELARVVGVHALFLELHVEAVHVVVELVFQRIAHIARQTVVDVDHDVAHVAERVQRQAGQVVVEKRPFAARGALGGELALEHLAVDHIAAERPEQHVAVFHAVKHFRL